MLLVDELEFTKYVSSICVSHNYNENVQGDYLHIYTFVFWHGLMQNKI